MKHGKTLEQLIAEINRQASSKRDLIVRTDKIQMETIWRDDHPSVPILNLNGSEIVGINELAHDQIGQHVAIPANYYDRMRREEPHLLAENVNRWLRRNPVPRLVRTMDSTARAFLSDSYRPLENIDLAESVLPVLMELDLELISSEITERKLYLKAVDKRINRDIPANARIGDGSHHIFDTCSPAIVISNSEVGSGQLSVETAVWTRQCTNLATFAQHSMKKRHVGARHEMAIEGISELLSNETRAATDKALWLQVRDVVKGAFDEARFAARIDTIKATTEQPIEADPVKVVEFTRRRFSMTEGEGSSILRHLVEGGTLSRYGLFNAITRTAEDLANYDRASDFERIGGQIIDLPRNQWQAISTAAGDPLKLALAA